MNNFGAQKDQEKVRSLPLSGKTVLVTRPRNQAEEICAMLNENGAHVLCWPMIEIVEPDSWDECDRVIRSLNRYDGAVFTSRNAAEYFFQRVRTISDIKNVQGLELFAVGLKTQKMISAFGLNSTVYPDVVNSAELASALLKRDLHGKQFLFPHGDKARNDIPETLRNHGVSVDAVTVYKTVAPSASAQSRYREEFRKVHPDILTFFSPTSVKNFKQIFSANIQSVVAVVGGTTRATAIAEGLNVQIVAEHASSADVVRSIVHYYQHR